MRFCYIAILSLLLASCEKIVDLKKLLNETHVTLLNPSTDEVIRGVVADGYAIAEIKVEFNAKANPTTIEIVAEDTTYGLFGASQSTTEESSISYNVTEEDLDRGYALLYLQSEESLPSTLATSSIATINYDVTITTKDQERLAMDLPVEVVRTPVVFAHGFGSDRTTYDPMLGYITPKGLYLADGLYALDYSSTSLSSYDVNKLVIPEAIDHIKSSMLESGYLAEKVIVVGHSMGGVLTRLYMQSSYGVDYRDDILKIVTIDSPYTGTQLADFGVALADKYPDSPLKIIYNIGAIMDFQVDSDATLKDLNGESLNSVILPTHILSATFGDTKSIVDMISREEYVQALLSFLIQHVATENIYGEPNDLIVPLSSQICGIEEGLRKEFVTTYSGEWHCSVHTTELAANDVMELLDTPSSDSKRFSTAGFKPSFLSYDSANDAAVTMVEKSESEISALATTLITLGLNANGEIIDMGYKSSDKSIEMTNSEVVNRYTLGVSSSIKDTLLFHM